jgi:hypothetical protein
MINCLGQEQNINCFVTEDGKYLTDILAELAALKSSSAGKTAISSDDITSKSLIRNTSYVCSSKITKRDFVYNISNSANSVVFSWDFLPVISALPTGFKLAISRVKVSGNSASGGNFIVDSQTPSGGIPINLSNFPITADISVRLTTPCGQVDLTSQIHVVNPAITGDFRTRFDVRDLNPQAGTINLTQQLNSLEDQIVTLRLEIENLKAN